MGPTAMVFHADGCGRNFRGLVFLALARGGTGAGVDFGDQRFDSAGLWQYVRATRNLLRDDGPRRFRAVAAQFTTRGMAGRALGPFFFRTRHTVFYRDELRC